MAQFDLVFEGGGAKGSVFVGALEVFNAAGHTAARLVGTSAGAITATLLAAGFTPAEMLSAVNEQLEDGRPRFASFMDVPVQDEFDATAKGRMRPAKHFERGGPSGNTGMGGKADRCRID